MTFWFFALLFCWVGWNIVRGAAWLIVRVLSSIGQSLFGPTPDPDALARDTAARELGAWLAAYDQNKLENTGCASKSGRQCSPLAGSQRMKPSRSSSMSCRPLSSRNSGASTARPSMRTA